jgi:hypothetical protein
MSKKIGIGINENVTFSKAVKNDQGTLIVGFSEYGNINPLDALNSAGSTQLEKAERDITVWPVKKDSFAGVPLEYDELVKKIAEVKDPLAHILQAHLPTSSINWDIFKGTNVTAENIKTSLAENLDKIYDNIVTQFIKMATPVLGKTPVRLLLTRQSAAKAFPTFRKRWLESQPFIEPMTVPASASKIKFSKYEIEKGLDKWEAATANTTASVEEAKEAEELFS